MELKSPRSLRVNAAKCDAKPTISAIGLGQVGVDVATGMAHSGHRVVGVDFSQSRLSRFARGTRTARSENSSDELRRAGAKGLISTTEDLAAAVRGTDVSFVSIAVPVRSDGSPDTCRLEQAARAMAVGLCQKEAFHVFAVHCAVPPGTTLGVVVPILEAISRKTAGRDFGISVSSSFSDHDAVRPRNETRTSPVIGASDLRTSRIMRRLLAPGDEDFCVTTIETAEMVAHAATARDVLTKCFDDEINRLCRALGVNGPLVMEMVAPSDSQTTSRDSAFAVGGRRCAESLQTLSQAASTHGLRLPLLENLELSHVEHVTQALRMVRAAKVKRVGVLGLAHLWGTDDLHQSPVFDIMAQLHADGVELYGHDMALTSDRKRRDLCAEVGTGSAKMQKLAKDLPDIFCQEIERVVSHADLVLVCHPLPAYRVALEWSGTPAIDLAGLYRSAPQGVDVQGLGWS